MSTMIVEEKFPCGYEIKVILKSLIGTPFYENEGVCPLHGKKCVIGGISE